MKPDHDLSGLEASKANLWLLLKTNTIRDEIVVIRQSARGSLCAEEVNWKGFLIVPPAIFCSDITRVSRVDMPLCRFPVGALNLEIAGLRFRARGVSRIEA